MFKKFWELLEKHEETEKQQNNMIAFQAKQSAILRITISNVKVITELNRAGMTDLYLNKINELVTDVENHN